MVTATAIVLAGATLLEVAGFAIIAGNYFEAHRAAREWHAANPAANPDGALGQLPLLHPIVQHLLGKPGRNALAAGLIFAGIITTAAANFMSLAR